MRQDPLYNAGDYLDPYGPKADGAFIGSLELCLDALGDQDGIAEKEDIDLVKTHVQLRDLLQGEFSWNLFAGALRETYFKDSTWLTKADLPKDAWDELQVLVKGSSNAPLYQEVFHLWLSDQLKALPDRLIVCSSWLDFSQGGENLHIYYTAYHPADIQEPVPSVILLPGLGTSPYFYRDLAIAWAKKGYRAIVLDDPAGRFSYGWKPDGLPKDQWGYSGSFGFLELRRNILDHLIKTRIGTSPFVLASFSDGLPIVLSWQKDHAGSYASQFRGTLDLVGTWALSRRPGYFGPLSVDGVGKFIHTFPINPGFRNIRSDRIFQQAGSDDPVRQRLRTIWYSAITKSFHGRSYGRIWEWTHGNGKFQEEIGEIFNPQGHYFFIDPFDDVFIDPVRSLERLIAVNKGSKDLQVVFFGSSGMLGEEGNPEKKKIVEKLRNSFSALGRWNGLAEQGLDLIYLPDGRTLKIFWVDTETVGHMLHLSPSALGVIVESTKEMIPLR